MNQNHRIPSHPLVLRLPRTKKPMQLRELQSSSREDQQPKKGKNTKKLAPLVYEPMCVLRVANLPNPHWSQETSRRGGTVAVNFESQMEQYVSAMCILAPPAALKSSQQNRRDGFESNIRLLQDDIVKHIIGKAAAQTKCLFFLFLSFLFVLLCWFLFVYLSLWVTSLVKPD